MNMPCLSLLAYYKQVDTILEALEAEAKDKMRMAGQIVHSHMLKENGNETSDAVVDAAVLFVETWAKRGFNSLTGVAIVIALDTGEVLECRNCTLKKTQCQSNDEFEEWQITHLASGECDINFTGR